jgi:hypothetical protein
MLVILYILERMIVGIEEETFVRFQYKFEFASWYLVARYHSVSDSQGTYE